MLEQLKQRLVRLPRRWKRLLTIAFDVLALWLSVWLAYNLRLGGIFDPRPVQVLVGAVAPVIAVPIFIRLGLYRAVIRYLPDRMLVVIAQAMFLATVGWVAVLFLTAMYGLSGVPRSVPVIYFILGTAIIAGSRFSVKRWLGVPPPPSGERGYVLIYGANEAGVQLAAALATNRRARVAGFIDDDRAFHGHDVAGYRVYPPSAIDGLVRNIGVSEIVVSMPSLPLARRQQIYESLRALPVRISTLPAITDLASGKYPVAALREIDIDDLLGRRAGSSCSMPTNSRSTRSAGGSIRRAMSRSSRCSARSPTSRWCAACSPGTASRRCSTRRPISMCRCSRAICSKGCGTTSSAPRPWHRRRWTSASAISC
jgi:FlaA1/EpsC-like NDP-sugar epimerase